MSARIAALSLLVAMPALAQSASRPLRLPWCVASAAVDVDGDEPSTTRIAVVPGGIRFKDYGNAGESPGWWVSTCRWNGAAFECSGKPEQ